MKKITVEENKRRLSDWGACYKCGDGAIGFCQGIGFHCDKPECDPIDWNEIKK